MTSQVHTIVAIGGGSMPKGETLLIDRRIKALTGKKYPHALFIPTASSDDGKYIRGFEKMYGKTLQCRTDILRLIASQTPMKNIRAAIARADIIYVGGGNTLMMMKLWRKLGVDTLLKKAYARGAVCCGISAGAICWFREGHSDSRFYTNPKTWQYIRVRGLGIIPAFVCPHFDGATAGRKRAANFRTMLAARGGEGVGIENFAALEMHDGNLHSLSARKGAKVFLMRRAKDGRISSLTLPA